MWATAAVFPIAAGVLRFGDRADLAGILCLATIAATALGLGKSKRFHVFAFSAWVLLCAAAGVRFPEWFGSWGGFEAKSLILPLTQAIMFGMGATLSIRDFASALAMPKPVLVGVFLQYSVMPCIGWSLARAFDFSPEVSAGVVLIGACSGGVASNVMTFLARGNVALSVTMTACSTMLAPLATPFAMKILAGQFVPVDILAMTLGVLKLVVIPVGLGIAANAVLKERRRVLERILPGFSMFLVCFTLALIAAQVRDGLFRAGLLLVAAAFIHNVAGLILGFHASRLAGLDTTACRTVAFEVGMQNGGMGIGLALAVLHSPEAAIASGLFAVWMNFTGASLASWWREKPAVG